MLVQAVNPFLGQIAIFDIFGVDHKVDMRVMSSIVKCRVPVHFQDWYLMRFRYLHGISADEFSPCRCFVVAKPSRVLTGQADNMSPDNSFVACNFVTHLIQVNYIIGLILISNKTIDK